MITLDNFTRVVSTIHNSLDPQCQAAKKIHQFVGMGVKNMFSHRIWKDDGGAVGVEYPLLAALISIAAIIGIQGLGTSFIQLVLSLGQTIIAATGAPAP